MSKTVVFKANETGSPCLAAFHMYGHIQDFPLTGRTSFGRMGSREQAVIGVPVAAVSGLHGEFGCAEGHWFYRDRGSTNGSRVNGQALTEVREMLDGDVLTVVPKDENSEEPVFAGIFIRLAPGEELVWRQIPLEADGQTLRIGREESGLSPDDPTLSRVHAIFRKGADGLYVLDEGSLNGVFVNGARCGDRRLRLLDVVRLGRTWFVLTDGVLWEGEIRIRAAGQGAAETQAGWQGMKNADTAPSETRESAPGAAAAQSEGVNAGSAVKRAADSGISAVSGVNRTADSAVSVQSAAAPVLGYQRETMSSMSDSPASNQEGGKRLVIDIDERSVRKGFKTRVLLADIHLTIDPGDMVLILGGSGAGKTTFMRSVMGYDIADGTIRYGDKDVYEDYETMKREIGYVPQQDLVRLGDSVGDTLMAAARLRMPGDSSLREQEERVDWLMDILGLREEKDNLIGALSGGQRKRVSIGMELAADPALFFLDEPDSGLDGVMARGLMEKLKVIADLGKIVLVITHTPDRAADLFTKVVVLGKTEDNVGHLLFYGRPDEALAFFGTDRLENIVHRINKVSEGGEGLADHFHDRFKEEVSHEK